MSGPASDNWNCQCPECGQTEQIDVAATVWVRLVGDGTDADLAQIGDHDFDGDSPALCGHCGHSAPYAKFLPTSDDATG